jgi:hypothetical protein
MTDTYKPWFLFLDDLRTPYDAGFKNGAASRFVVARSTMEAVMLVRENGMPKAISFDHDLGGADTAMVFLRWLANDFWDGNMPVPEFHIHSANPVGKANIASFMSSWHRSLALP